MRLGLFRDHLGSSTEFVAIFKGLSGRNERYQQYDRRCSLNFKHLTLPILILARRKFRGRVVSRLPESMVDRRRCRMSGNHYRRTFARERCSAPGGNLTISLAFLSAQPRQSYHGRSPAPRYWNRTPSGSAARMKSASSSSSVSIRNSFGLKERLPFSHRTGLRQAPGTEF